MNGYLLDTNVLSEVLKNRPDRGVLDRLAEVPASHVTTSVVCVMELRVGAARHPHGRRLWERIASEVLARVRILPLSEDDAIRAGDLLATLEAQGTPIGVEDVLIGATALEQHLTVVTRNTRHYQRIPSLDVESWWS